MSITYSQFFPATVLTTSAATLYTVPSAPSSLLLRGARMRFTNTTAGPITVTAYAIQSGGSASASNSFLTSKSIAAGDVYDTDIPLLGPGGFVQALASANTSITVTALSGALFS